MNDIRIEHIFLLDHIARPAPQSYTQIVRGNSAEYAL